MNSLHSTRLAAASYVRVAKLLARTSDWRSLEPLGTAYDQKVGLIVTVLGPRLPLDVTAENPQELPTVFNSLLGSWGRL